MSSVGPMPIRVTCSNCRGVLTAPDAAAGKRGKCPKCKTAIPIPAVSDPPVPAKRSGPLPTAAVVRAADAFDVEILPDPPPAAVPVAPPPPVHFAPPQPIPAPANPFAVFGPPPDSVAAKLLAASTDGAAGRPPLDPGWESVGTGFGSLRISAQIGLAVTALAMLGSMTSVLQTPLAFYVVVALLLAASLAGLALHVIGLVRCLKMPPPEHGGAGRGLALTALILTAAGVVLAPCFGVGAIALVALPFVLGVFLRTVSRTLADRPAAAAAVRFMIAAGVAILAALVTAVAVAVFAPGTRGSAASIRTAQILILVLSLGSGVVNLAAAYLYLAALTQAERAVRSAVRTRGVAAADDRARRPVQPRDFDDEAPTPLATSRPRGRARGDSNPIA